ncbi:RES family NAD+ phosphorylase, partial [Flavobacterium akiainvivens]
GISTEYPIKEIPEESIFYRIRKNLSSPESEEQYDSAPDSCLGQNRLDSTGLPILYASQNLELCVHECRVTMADNTYVATLQPTRSLKFLDLTHILHENVGEFESLDIAIHMLFSAPEHSYDICREIAKAAHIHGYDGLIYPSYFSTLGTGSTPFPTLLGFSIRQFEELKDYARAQVIENIAIFGRPLRDGKIIVRSINRVVLNKVEYDLRFGPVQI